MNPEPGRPEERGKIQMQRVVIITTQVERQTAHITGLMEENIDDPLTCN
jgi:hypothetical protein